MMNGSTSINSTDAAKVTVTADPADDLVIIELAETVATGPITTGGSSAAAEAADVKSPGVAAIVGVSAAAVADVKGPGIAAVVGASAAAANTNATATAPVSPPPSSSVRVGAYKPGWIHLVCASETEATHIAKYLHTLALVEGSRPPRVSIAGANIHGDNDSNFPYPIGTAFMRIYHIAWPKIAERWGFPSTDHLGSYNSSSANVDYTQQNATAYGKLAVAAAALASAPAGVAAVTGVAVSISAGIASLVKAAAPVAVAAASPATESGATAISQSISATLFAPPSAVPTPVAPNTMAPADVTVAADTAAIAPSKGPATS